jgi:hypothetical protein
MANSNRIVVSKIRATGSMRSALPNTKTRDQIDGRALKNAYCSYDNDNITTYVQKKEWVINLNDYLFPPYVECEYVM